MLPKLLLSCLLISSISARVHEFTVKSIRNFRLPISTFGYYKDGVFNATIKLTRKDAPLNAGNPPIGFTFDRSLTVGGIKRMEQEEDLMDELEPVNQYLPCILDLREAMVIQKLTDMEMKDPIDRITFKITFDSGDNNEPIMEVWKTPFFKEGVEVYNRAGNGFIRSTPLSFQSFNPGYNRSVNEPVPANNKDATLEYTAKEAMNLGYTVTTYPLKFESDGKGGENQRELEIKFKVRVVEDTRGGIYELNFHDCYNRNELINDHEDERPNFDMQIEVYESNLNSYLSAGLMFLPEMYFFMFMLFVGATFVWYNVLISNRSKTFKIHWLMAIVITVKSLSLLAHSIDYFYIDKDGKQHSWAIIFYIIHTIRGILLFFTLALIATGWSFVKCVLSDNERRVFMIVLPLQVIANIAFVVIESSEEAQANYQDWQEIAIFVDLICCGAIMFPIIWSIRHLTQATQTDGKGAVALRKLELFKKFYAWTIAYIYLTRIGGLLLSMALPYNLEWFGEFIKEGATFCYFVYTGYLFRPGSDQNPYIRLRSGEGSDEDRANLLQSGAMEGVKKRTNMSRKIDSGSDSSENEDELVDTIALIKAAKTPSSNV